MEAFARLQARLEAEAAAAGGDAPVVLNGRGYNYGPGRDPVREMQVLQAERARERRAALKGSRAFRPRPPAPCERRLLSSPRVSGAR